MMFQNLATFPDSEIVVLSNILKYMPKKQIPSVRFVSRIWNRTFLTSQLHRFEVNISGSEDADKTNQTFNEILDTKGEWQRFKIKDFNLKPDSEYFAIIEMCFTKFNKSIRSIQIANCHIPMAQFWQLFAIPKMLEELRIVNCTGLYSGGLEAVLGQPYMESFHQNVTQLKKIQLTDTHAQYNPLGIWLSRSERLVELKSEMYGYPSPIDGGVLGDIFRTNNTTLRYISLAYLCLDSAILSGMASLSLQSLRLQNCNIPSPIIFHEFLQSQKIMASLSFVNIKLESHPFTNVHFLTSLKYISFHDCQFDPGVLQPLSYGQGFSEIRRVAFIGTPNDIGDVRTFLDQPMPSVKFLKLQLGQGTDTLFGCIAKSFPNLRNLDLSRNGVIQNENLCYLWNLKQLRKLVITNSQFNGTEFRVKNRDPMRSLLALEILDLSFTNADELTVQQIIKLKLKHLTLKGTQITEDAIQKLFDRFQHRLKTFDLTECVRCIIAEDYFNYLRALCPSFQCATSDADNNYNNDESDDEDSEEELEQQVLNAIDGNYDELEKVRILSLLLKDSGIDPNLEP